MLKGKNHNNFGIAMRLKLYLIIYSEQHFEEANGVGGGGVMLWYLCKKPIVQFDTGLVGGGGGGSEKLYLY